jgi:hypothetical protein
MWTENVAWFSSEKGKKGRIEVRCGVGDVHDFTTVWGALGCACWAV